MCYCVLNYNSKCCWNKLFSKSLQSKKFFLNQIRNPVPGCFWDLKRTGTDQLKFSRILDRISGIGSKEVYGTVEI